MQFQLVKAGTADVQHVKMRYYDEKLHIDAHWRCNPVIPTRTTAKSEQSNASHKNQTTRNVYLHPDMPIDIEILYSSEAFLEEPRELLKHSDGLYILSFTEAY